MTGRSTLGRKVCMRQRNRPRRRARRLEGRTRRRANVLDHGLAVATVSPLARYWRAVMDTLDIALRLGTATLVGVVLGLNRDLHGKVTGVRTLGLVCLGSALAVLSVHAVNGTDASRVIQGIVTGVGFLGAGVIVRNNKGRHVHGLTTAACVWVAACIGAACGCADVADRCLGCCTRSRHSGFWRTVREIN
jgi:putative Mg2+ transporter-C (MgtC) family protein